LSLFNISRDSPIKELNKKFFVFEMKRGRSSTPEETAAKATLKKLDTIISNRDPVKREKQKAYSKDPKVQERRRFMNKKRRQLHTLLAHLLKMGHLSYMGQPISEIGNRIVIPQKKIYGWLGRIFG